LAVEAAIAVEHGAQGIGLYRTEFLYVDRRDPPGEEEQLILAEAQGGQAAVDAINRVRAAHNLPAYTGGTANVAAQIREERQRELFLEGSRLWDMRRFDVALFPATGTPFPKGGVYGDARCLPLPDVERANNPNLN
jgi:hypothetical protein